MLLKNYLSLVKFSHTLFAMPFALIGFALGVKENYYGIHSFPWELLVLTLLCMVFARNAAMGFNRYIDRKYDALNERTSQREIPSGVVKPTSALYFVIANCALFIACCYFINPLALYLSPIALIVVLGYSYTKRFTSLCHFVLGMALSIAPMGAYIVVTGRFSMDTALFSILVLFWVGGFDILYSLPDENFDKNLNLNSIPVLLGRKKAMILSTIIHLIAAIIVLIIGLVIAGNSLFWIGAGLFIILLTYQHLIISPTDLRRLNAAFFTTNGIASLVFAIFTILALFINI